MKEYRCKFCHKLLFKYNNMDFMDGQSIIEIKCSKCGKIQEVIVPLCLAATGIGKVEFSLET